MLTAGYPGCAALRAASARAAAAGHGEDSVNDWLKQCPAWQSALFWGMALALGGLLGGIMGQVWKQHFDWGELAGMAVGGAAAGSFAGLVFRVNQRN